MTLKTLIRAERDDLLDGYPLRAAMKALSAEGTRAFKLEYLNQLLEPDLIEVKLVKTHEFLLPGFKEAGISGALTYSDGSIEVHVNSSFLAKQGLSIVERALRFQSIIIHELVHRRQFAAHTLHATVMTDDKLSTAQYMNDPYELEAMAAEIAHDTLTSAITSSQPRLADLMLNAKQFSPTALSKLQAHIKELKS